jgi:N utilization substance protein B
MEKQIKKSQRRDNRFHALQFIYSWEINRPEILAHAMMEFFDNLEKPRVYFQFGEELVQGIVEKVEELDAEIERRAENYKMSRIGRVDLSILRLATYEMQFRNDIPPIVTINEAIDLTKLFSSHDSKRFINGILDAMSADIKRPLREAQN